MQQRLLTGFVLAASVAVASAAMAPSQRRPPSDPDPVMTEGRTLYRAHCASCHGASGRGDGPVADSLRRRPSDLTQLTRRNGGVFPSATTSRIIDGRDVGAHGSVEMPVWGDVFKRTEGNAEARIAAVVRYLESLQERTGE